MGGCDFWDPSLDHSVLIHIYDGSFFHKERPPLQTFEIPLPIRLCSLVKYIYKQGFAQWLPVKVGMVLFSASKELFWYLNPVSKINRLRKNKTVPGIHLIKKIDLWYGTVLHFPSAFVEFENWYNYLLQWYQYLSWKSYLRWLTAFSEINISILCDMIDRSHWDHYLNPMWYDWLRTVDEIGRASTVRNAYYVL